MEFIDTSGKPRSDEEISQAIDQIEKEIVKADFSNPSLYMQFIPIKEALEELLSLRAKIREAIKTRG